MHRGRRSNEKQDSAVERMKQASTSPLPAGYEFTQAGTVRKDMRGRPKVIKPGEIAVLLWYKHEGYPYWPSLIKQVTTDRSKCTVSLLNLGVLEKKGITVAMDCLGKLVKDFLGEEHEDLVDAGSKFGPKAFEIALRKSRYLRVERQVKTSLSAFFVETGYLTNGSASGAVPGNDLTDPEQKYNQRRSAGEISSGDLGGTAVANQRVRARKHARSSSENSRPVSRRATDKRRCLSEGRSYALRSTGEAHGDLDDLTEVADAETDDRNQSADLSLLAATVDPQQSPAVDDDPAENVEDPAENAEDPEGNAEVPAGKRETGIGPSRIVVQVEVHAPFDGNPDESSSRARQLSSIDERSRTASLEALQRLTIAQDWNDDLMVLDDGSPTKLCPDMLAWYKHKEEPFWPALIESVKEGKFTVRLLNYGPVPLSTFTVNEEETSKVLLPYPGADYVALTGGQERCSDASAFVGAVKQANTYVQMKQGRRIAIGAGEFLKRFESTQSSAK